MSPASELFDIQPRFVRATHLIRDYTDPDALNGYVLTPSVVQVVKRLAAGLTLTSTQRAWRITGDYGSGKSSLALLLAHLIGRNLDHLPDRLSQELARCELNLPRTRLIPLLVVASSQPLTLSLLSALEGVLVRLDTGGDIIERIRDELAPTTPEGAETRAIALIEEAATHVQRSGYGAGLLVIIDELGKFLEYAAHNPDRQDPYILQQLADAAARSGGTPVFVVGLLHQGIAAYADQLSRSAVMEWEKVAGRFEEIFLNHPLEQIAALIAAALNVRIDRLDNGLASKAHESMERACALGWYGPGASRTSLIRSSAGCFPLHPMTIPAMVLLFRRFGQNERSLFNFLIGNEPLALQEHALLNSTEPQFYRLHDLYDYARGVFGYRLSVQSYRSHWNHIDSVVQSFAGQDECEVRILKTVGLLNLLDSLTLLPTEEALLLAVLEPNQDREEVIRRLHDLQHNKRVLYYRGKSAGYCLWPHTSINLDNAYEEAKRAIGTEEGVLGTIERYLDTRPVVARRHYIETGNLRYFSVRYVSPGDLPSALEESNGDADGRILVVLCQTEAECREAVRLASTDMDDRRSMLVAVPSPLRNLTSLVQEYIRWQWVVENTPELVGDPYAAEEISRQITNARQALENRIQDLVGVRQFTGTASLSWFYRGEELQVENGRALVQKLSEICNAVFSKAPNIHNELVNRRSLSSAASAARLRLIGSILSSASVEFLGMDPSQRPPEMAMYFSVLHRNRLHREENGRWELAEPAEAGDPGKLRPVFGAIRKVLESSPDARVTVNQVFEELRQPPYGVRSGLLPVILAVFVAIHEHEVAFYENGNFLVRITADDFMRLIKDPRLFEVQLCRVDGIRSAVYERILDTLELPFSAGAPVELLDVVRPLCTFAARLPYYTRNTTNLSARARAVRTALLRTQEPPTLLFRELPTACGLPSFGADEAIDVDRVQNFVGALKSAMDELRSAYPKLLERVRDTLGQVFAIAGDCTELRHRLRQQAVGPLATVSDIHLKAFYGRLVDPGLPNVAWLESVASITSEAPPAKWKDADEERYHRDVHRLGQRLLRVESLFGAVRDEGQRATAHRLLITRADGSEIDGVCHVPAGQEQLVAELEQRFLRELRANGLPGMTAAARAVWAVLEATHDQS